MGFFKKLYNAGVKIKNTIFFWCNEFDDIDIPNALSITSSPSNSIDNSFCFQDKIYIVQRYKVTSGLFNYDDLGKFVTDVDGICLHLNKKTADFIGKSKRKIRFNPICKYNLFREDIGRVGKIWDAALKDQTTLIYKERRVISSDLTTSNRIAYLIVEAYRIESRGYFKGYKGIMMRVTKPIWDRFNEDYVHKHFLSEPPSLKLATHHNPPCKQKPTLYVDTSPTTDDEKNHSDFIDYTLTFLSKNGKSQVHKNVFNTKADTDISTPPLSPKLIRI